jgi:hypothetical protein
MGAAEGRFARCFDGSAIRSPEPEYGLVCVTLSCVYRLDAGHQAGGADTIAPQLFFRP